MRKTFVCIETHTCGHPMRLVVVGGPLLPHVPVAERREIFIRDHDWIRQSLMFEPRGSDIMSGGIIYPPYRNDCDFAVIFIEVGGCNPMCGAGTIGLVTAVIEEGLITPKVPGRLSIETPAGKIDAEYEMRGALVESVRLRNVPSYLHLADIPIDVPGLGHFKVDVAYGGNYYLVVEPQENWSGLDGMSAWDIIVLSRKLRSALREICTPTHPNEESITGVHHVLLCDVPLNPESDGRGVVFYGEKGIDRSPGGTGTSARMAQLYAKGKITVGDTYRQESLFGTRFVGRIEAEAIVGGYKAIMPSVTGCAKVIGHNTIFVEDTDPLARGFQLA